MNTTVPPKKYQQKSSRSWIWNLGTLKQNQFQAPWNSFVCMFININVFFLPISDFIPHLFVSHVLMHRNAPKWGDNVMGVGRCVCAPVEAGGQPRMSFLRCTHAGGFVLCVFRQSSADPGLSGYTGWAVSPKGLFIPSSVPELQMGTTVRDSQTVLKVRLFLPVFGHLPPWMKHHNQLSFS